MFAIVTFSIFAGLLVAALVAMIRGLVSVGYTATITQGATSITQKNTYNGNTLVNVGIAISNGATNTEQDVYFTYTAVQAFYILSDQNITLKTNSSGSPTQTFTLVAGVPFQWTNDGYITCPFTTANVTKFFWTNASGSTANIQGFVLYNG